MARFSRGLLRSVVIACQTWGLILMANKLGSYDGMLAIARMSPVRGSIAIAAPACIPLACKASYAAFWTSRSRVRTMARPGMAGARDSTRSGRPRASTSIRSRPSVPRSTVS